MLKINICKAKTNLSKYIKMLEQGVEDEVIIMRDGKEIATLSLYKKKRVGAALGIIEKKEFSLKDPAYNIEELFGY